MNERRCSGCMRKLDSFPICPYCGHDARTENASHQLPQGTVLKEQYLLGRVLGQGGFGITYMGWDLYLDIPVAIKEYFPSGMVMRDCSVTHTVTDCMASQSSQFQNNRERFLREAKVLARFSQVPEIVQVRNFFLSNNTAYIVMEYVEGITLKNYVARHGGKLSFAQTMNLLRPLMIPLSRIHKAGLVHRDISPENIMVLPDGGIKLLDFGAVRDLGSVGADKSTQAILRHGYAPIEQYQKRGDLGPWTDVYALCGTMYFCMTGEVPVDSPERILGEEEIAWRENVPELTEAQEAALQHGMAVRSENRCRSVEDLYRELFGDPEAAPKAPEKEQPAPAAKPQMQERREEKPAEKSRTVQTGNRSKVSEHSSKPGSGTKESEKKTSAKKPARPKHTAGHLRLVWLAVLACVAVAAGVLMLPDSVPGEIPGTSSESAQKELSGSCGPYSSWEMDPESGTLTVSGSRNIDDYDSPEATPWYALREEIRQVVLEEGITTVGSNAFSELPALKAVTFAQSVENIGYRSFSNSPLEDADLAQILEIHEEAFSGTKLGNITLSSRLRLLESGAFSYCSELYAATAGEGTVFPMYNDMDLVFTDENNRIPDGFQIWAPPCTMAQSYAELMGYDFQTNRSNTWEAQGTCGKNLEWYYDSEAHFLRIEGNGAMQNYSHPKEGNNPAPWMEFVYTPSALQYVMIGENVTSIGAFAFALTDVKHVYIGGNVRDIGSKAFLDTELESIIIPDSVLTIQSFAFNWCRKLTSVELPYHLKKLDRAVFNKCSALESLYVGPETYLTTAGGYTPFNHDLDPELPENLTIYSLAGSNAQSFAVKNNFSYGIGWRGIQADISGELRSALRDGTSGWFIAGNVLVLYGDQSIDYNLTKAEMMTLHGNSADNSMLNPPPYAIYADQIREVKILTDRQVLAEGLLDYLTMLESVDFGSIVQFSRLGKTLENRENLKEVTISGAMEIPEGMFRNCNNLRAVYFGPDVRISSDPGFTSDNLILYVHAGSQAEAFAINSGLSYYVY